MALIRDVMMYARFASGLPAYLRRRMSADEARCTVRRRLEQREEAFLRLVRRGVFEDLPLPKTPSALE